MAAALASGCSGSGSNGGSNPMPQANSLSPNSATAGGAAFTLTVTGAGFVSSTTVQWNGSSRATTFVSSTQLTASIPASDIAAQGTAQVTVSSPAPGGGVSSALTFTINQANNPAPTLNTISPNTAAAGGVAFTLTVNGTNFVSASVVRWNGTNLTTTFVSAIQLTAQVPANLIGATGTAQVTVFNPAPGGGTSSGQTFTISAPPPVISDFNPKSTSVGTLVSVTGSNFTLANGSGPQIALAAQGGGTISAPISTFTATTASFVIPSGAASGVFMLTVGGQTANSSAALTIVGASSFTLSASPPSANVPPGQSVAYAVSIASTNAFSQAVTLSVSGLPAGVTASFSPRQVTLAQTSILTLTAPANQAAGPATLTISGSAKVQGIAESQSATVSLHVQSSGLTIFLGRTVVDDGPETPIQGVTVKFLGVDDKGNSTGCSGQTISDGAGNFELTNLSSSCVGPQLIAYDGSTATSPPGVYAGVNLSYALTAGQVTTSSVLIHLPRIDNAETVQVQQNAAADQIFTFRTIPNLVVTVYAGTTFTLGDGTKPNPFPLIAVQVPVDRLPDQMPTSGFLTPFIVAFQPANAVASQPVGVNFPNTLSTLPGTTVTLTTLDPTRGFMVPYGTATVSSDGTKFIADADPAHPGHSYGLVHFDWHGPAPPAPGPTPGHCGDSCCGAGGGGGGGPQSGDPIDLASGIQLLRVRDIAINGQRTPIFIERVYRTLSTNPGPFGIGTSHNYAYQANTILNPTTGQGAILLIAPDGSQNMFNVQPDSTFINSTFPSLRGAVMTHPSETVVNLRFRDGSTYFFQSLVSGQFIFYLTSITDANGNTIAVTHGNPSFPDQITRVTDPVGRSLTFAYDSSDRVTSITDPLGRTVSYVYNPQGTLAMVTDPAGGSTIYTYDSQNRLAQIKDARGVVMAQNTYDANGRVIQQVQADGGVIKFAYTLLNPMVPASPVLRTDVTDPLGNTTTYRFDPNGFLLNVTDPTGQMRNFIRDPQHFNLVASVSGGGICDVCGDPKAGNESYTYDANGNLLTKTDSLGNTTTYTYDPVVNKLTSVTDPLGKATKYTYDSRGNLLTTTDPNGRTTTRTLDPFGRVTQLTDPLGHNTTYSFGAFGDTSTITDPLGNMTRLNHDGVSRVVQIVNARGVTTEISYDALGRKVATTQGQGNTIRRTYDPTGHLLSLTDEQGQTTSFAYDAFGRLASLTDPRGKKATLSYDLNGNLTGSVNRRGQTFTSSYDALNRLTGQAYEDGSTVTFSYDAKGRPVHVVDTTSGTFDFSYDSVGRRTDQTTPYGSIQYSYDAAGRVTSRQVVGQPAVSYTYDAAGNMLSASLGQTSMTLAYDARNQLLSLTRSNGVMSQYTYDSAGRLVSLAHSGGQGIQIPFNYAYDPADNRSLFTTNGTEPQGATNTFDAAHRLIQSGATTYTYDDNGNLISATDSAGTTTYSWDARDHLQSISATGGQKTMLVYDFAGNLISQTDSGPSSNLTQNFVLDDVTNVAYISRSNGDSLSVLAARGIDTHLAVVHANGQVEYGLPDAQNSTAATPDQTGKVVSSFSYEPYGKTTTSSTYPFQFTGRLPVAGNLYYYRARYCDSKVGRFISQDPLALLDGRTTYVYADNSPFNKTDPRGLQNVRPKVTPNAIFVPCDNADLTSEFGEFLLNVASCVGCLFEFGAAVKGQGPGLGQFGQTGGGKFCGRCLHPTGPSNCGYFVEPPPPPDSCSQQDPPIICLSAEQVCREPSP
jgi:RHS repeat-associated protein